MPTTGLRFFTVYGPWGRPDMALFMFVESIIKKKKINVFNKGKMSRDFTYVDDIVNGVVSVLEKPNINNKIKNTPYSIFNIGSGKSIKLMSFIKEIEKNLKIKSQKRLMGMQLGDVKRSLSSVRKLEKWIGYNPKFNVKIGIKNFIGWYLKYYKIKL